jgi:hypothetical protein
MCPVFQIVNGAEPLFGWIMLGESWIAARADYREAMDRR